MKELQIKFSAQFFAAIVLLLTRVKSKKRCKPGEEDVTSQPFDLTARYILRLRKDIIFESNVLGWLDCGTSCLEKRACVAFNFKEESKEKEINCQLTQTTDHNFEIGSTDDNGWMFYEAVGEKMFGCEECLIDEKLIWDPVKPLGCKCPESNYVGQISEKCPLALHFLGHTVNQYGISTGSPEELQSITACFWMSVPEAYLKDHRANFLSYASSQSPNDFLLALRPSLDLLMKGGSYSTGLHLADGKLHHVCVTWESSNGHFKVYKDGTLVKTLDNVKTGEKFNAGGIWVIGQDQDSLGGGFQTADSYKGILTEVNIWNKILGSDEIERFASDYGLAVEGNYKAYSDFDISSATELIKPSCCPLAPLPEA